MGSVMPGYLYQGARAMVLLHERHLTEFVEVWRTARAADLSLPETKDPDYESLEHLLRHVLGSARGYMKWMCGCLELGDPGIEEPPGVDRIAGKAGSYLGHILQRWRGPLARVEEERFVRPEYKSRWGVLYCIDAMLEHAVMHPIRHSFQLRSLAPGVTPRGVGLADNPF